MNHAPVTVELLRLSEYDVFASGKIEFLQGLYAFEPYDFHCCRAVREKSHKAHLGTFSECVERDEASAHLHRRHFPRETVDRIDLRTIHVVCREMVDQVVACAYLKLLFKQLCA